LAIGLLARAALEAQSFLKLAEWRILRKLSGTARAFLPFVSMWDGGFFVFCKFIKRGIYK
jgi:hypothetical protein